MSYEIEVLVNGRPAKKYGHEGRTYIEAREGTEYSIRVRNNTSRRIEAVATVDGLSVLDGQPGSKQSSGYVIPAFGSYEIKGFRTSNEQVNAFKFAAKAASYAANSEATGFSDQHCGAIAVVVFPEKPKPLPTYIRKEYVPVPYPYPAPSFPRPRPSPWDSPVWRGISRGINEGDMLNDRGTYVMSMMDDAAPRSRSLSANNVATRSFDLGTEFSDTVVQDKVTSTSFERDDEGPTFSIFYASRQLLTEMGVPLDKQVYVAAFPDPFPKDNGGFCKPPTRRR